MAKAILICGKTGTGKTTAARTLNPKQTLILRVINRTLPFKYKGMYKDGQIKSTPTSDTVIEALKWANVHTGVKNVVITDGTYIMRNEFFKRAKETGYGRFTDIAVHMQQVINTIQSCRDDLKVFLEFHVESAKDTSGILEWKPATVGKMLDEKYNIFENVDVILFADPQFKEGATEYGFWTNRTLDRNGAEIPAKSPDGMFEDLFIPNDLGLVSKAVDDYYGIGEEKPVEKPAEKPAGEVKDGAKAA